MNGGIRELLGMLAKLNQTVPDVVLGVLDDSLTPARQAEFGVLLVDAGRLVQSHAQERTKTIDSEGNTGLTRAEREEALRAVAGICVAAGRLLRELLDNALMPENAMTLGAVLVEAGQELRRYGRECQDAVQGDGGEGGFDEVSRDQLFSTAALR